MANVISLRAVRIFLSQGYSMQVAVSLSKLGIGKSASRAFGYNHALVARAVSWSMENE